jgi:diadenosine tetraphosphatase ApaH/serine/threonine PP2A family protein phosphatase
LPVETLELVAALGPLARFVRGNADRAVGEVQSRDDLSEIEAFQRRAHGALWERPANFEEGVSVDVEGLGPTRFCHGSPRSDEECVTEETPEERVRAFAEGVPERVIVHGHTHVQYERTVAGRRVLNPGSVGIPYEGKPGAFWALLGPDIELRRTEYDLDAAAARIRASGDPFGAELVEMLRTPPSREEAIARAEALVFAG